MSCKISRFWLALIALAVILVMSGCGREHGKAADTKKEPAVTAQKAGTAKHEKKDVVKKPDVTAPLPGASAPLPILGGGGSVADALLGGAKGLAAPSTPSAMPGMKGATGRVTPVPKIAPGKRPTSTQLLQIVQATYRNMKTLRLARVSSDTFTQDGKVMAKQQNKKSSFLFKRPNKFAVRSEEGATCSDGKTVYEYNAQAKRFVKGKMSDNILAGMVMGKPGVSTVGLLLGMDYTQHIKSSKLLADSKVGGRDTYVLLLDIKAPQGATASHKLWIGKKDYGIYKEELLTRMTPQAPPGYKGKVPKSVQSKSTATFTEFAPNVTLPDSSFTFKPPTGAKQFEPSKQMEKPKPLSLLDKQAPDFSFKWTDGTTKKLSDFKGRVVVLDFWALPMAEKHLPLLHSASKNAKEGVEIITICLNQDEAKIKDYLKGKGFSFPVAMATEDMAKTVMGDYRIIGVPTIYVIDKQGVVRRQIMGNVTEADLTAKIGKVAGM